MRTHKKEHTHTHTHTSTYYTKKQPRALFFEKESTLTAVTHLQVPVYHTHLMAVKHRLQDLLDAMAACKHRGGRMLV